MRSLNFNENLRRLRKENDYSQESLADKMNVTRQTISKWENGTAMPDLKKLTELADLFEVSMDDILGMNTGKESIDDSSKNTERIDFEYMNIILENQNKMLQKRIRIIFVVLLAAIIIFGCIFSSTYSSLNAQIVNLQNNISNNSVADDSPDNMTISDYCDVKILKVYEDKPYILSAQFKYEPENYAKDTKVYFTIPEPDGKINKLEAEGDNGVFTLVADIDLTVNSQVYIIVEEMNKISKEEVFFDFRQEYRYFDGIGLEVDYRRDTCVISKAIPDDDIACSKAFSDITKATLLVKYDGKNLYNKPIKFTEITDDYGTAKYKLDFTECSISDLPQNFDYKKIEIYFLLKDKNGVEYKFYPEIFAFASDDYQDQENRVILCFKKDGKTIEIPAFDSE